MTISVTTKTLPISSITLFSQLGLISWAKSVFNSIKTLYFTLKGLVRYGQCVRYWIYIHTYICVHVHMYTCIHVHMYICTYVHMYICTCVHMYTCTECTVLHPTYRPLCYCVPPPLLCTMLLLVVSMQAMNHGCVVSISMMTR